MFLRFEEKQPLSNNASQNYRTYCYTFVLLEKTSKQYVEVTSLFR
jgi:hypothetical protein